MSHWLANASLNRTKTLKKQYLNCVCVSESWSVFYHKTLNHFSDFIRLISSPVSGKACCTTFGFRWRRTCYQFTLTLIMLGWIFSRRQYEIYLFSFFRRQFAWNVKSYFLGICVVPLKLGVDIPCKAPPHPSIIRLLHIRRYFAWNVKSYFFCGTRRKRTKLLSSEFAQRMANVKKSTESCNPKSYLYIYIVYVRHLRRYWLRYSYSSSPTSSVTKRSKL